MSIHPAFGGHNLFCYLPPETQQHFKTYPVRPELPPATKLNGYAGAISAFKDMGIENVWIRLFGHEGPMPLPEAQRFVEVLRLCNIGVAGWGYSHGDDWKGDLKTALHHSQAIGLDAFIVDIEPARKLDGTVSKWGSKDLSDFIGGLAAHFGKHGLGVSTWPIPKIQHSKEIPTLDLLKSISGMVSFFAPQAYWMSYPTTVHYKATGLSEHDYPRNDPTSFARLVLQSWRNDGFTNDLSLTGQAYWGESAPPLDAMEEKISTFASTFSDWDKIIGLSWWHAGGIKAMSTGMVDIIKKARLNTKPYIRNSLPYA